MVEALLESSGQEVAVADHGSRAGTPIEYAENLIQINDVDLTPIQKFYHKQCIFLTGGTGFIGKLLIEKLLRSCPSISTIYLLVRSKKGKNTHERTETLFNDSLFTRLKEIHPKFRHKIIAIEGDCSSQNLGISEADQQKLIDDVSIVFHSAATVSFDEKIKIAISINIQGPREMIKLCKKMTKLKSFVHVSTAYAYCTENRIEEKFYKSPIDADKLMTIAASVDDQLAEQITPALMGKWPNTYAFTKAVAEDVIEKEASDMPIGVFRPAIVISTYREPLTGWIDNMYGPTGIAAGGASGLLRTVHCDGSIHANVVPGDMVANALLVTAWDISQTYESRTDIPIYNYVSQDNPITFDELKIMSAKYGIMYPTIKAMWYYSFRNNKYRFVHLLCVYLLHLLPALLIDSATICIGKKPKLLKMYKKIHKFLDVLNYFTIKQWSFTNNRWNNLIEKLDSRDKDIFFCNIKELIWDDFFKTYIQGIRIYLIKDPIETLPEARVKWQRMYWIHQVFKLVLAYIALRILWGILSTLITIIH